MAMGTPLFDTLPVRLRANPQFFGDSYSLKSSNKWHRTFPQALPELRKNMDVAGRRRRAAAGSEAQVEQACETAASRKLTPPPPAVTAPALGDLQQGGEKLVLTDVFPRTMYDHEDWSRHKSGSRHLRHLFATSSSRVFVALRAPVFILTLLAAVVAAWNCAVASKATFPAWIPVLRISALPFQFTAPALGLLLVFRTNASYGRFDEARKMWGSILNRTRDLTRQALSWIQSPDDADNLNRLLQYIVAFPVCLNNQLVPKKMLKDELSDLLETNELAALVASPHRPNHVLQMISGILQRCHLSDVQIALMDGNVTQFHDNLGACERIFRTPVPVSYTRLTSLFLVVWHLVLPLALWEQCGWTTVPAIFFSATALFCIDEVGVLIEEPFSILPLDSMCTTMHRSVQCLAESHARFTAIQATKPSNAWHVKLNKAGNRGTRE